MTRVSVVWVGVLYVCVIAVCVCYYLFPLPNLINLLVLFQFYLFN